jgi:flagellar M-ring protein FliF
MAGTKNFAEQVKQFWASRNGTQRAFLLGGAGATALLLMLFMRLIGTPDFKPLFTDLDPADVQTLSAQLDAQGIEHQTSPDGKTISVPADKVDAARMQTASQGAPHSGRMGFELFDKMSWGQTEFDEKVTYQRALEGELERSIQTLSDVESARVHLVMPTDSVFLDRQRTAKASVILKLKRGTLSKGAVLAISRLVSGAVDDLQPQDVSIVDADSDRALGLGQDPNGEDNAGNDLTARLASTLEPIVGADRIRASVNVDYDQGTTEESQEKYDPSVSAVLSEQKSSDQAGGGAAGGTGGTGVASGVPGTASNIPTKQAKPATPAAQTATQSSITDSAQYGVNRTVTHTVTPAGRVQRISAAILVDDEVIRTVAKGKVSFTRRKRTQDELNKIQELAEAVIGFDAKRGDTISVQNMSFDTDPADGEPAAATWSTTVQKTVSDYSSALRPVSLLLLFVMAYVFLLRPVQKHALAPGSPALEVEPLLTAGGVETLQAPQVEMGVDAMRASQLREQTSQLIRQKPVHTARAVQAWLSEEHS